MAQLKIRLQQVIEASLIQSLQSDTQGEVEHL